MVDQVEKDMAQEMPEQARPEGPAEPAEADLETQLNQAKAQAAEYLDQLQRTAADFANYRKRVARDRDEMTRFSSAVLLTKLLPILDDLERAMATLSPDLQRFTWIEGVLLIERKLRLILEGEGLKAIEAVGQPFDPLRHEAVIREETTACPDGQVMAELQRGYELHGRVLRPALVKVAAAPVAPPPPAPEATEAAPSDATAEPPPAAG